MGIDLLIIGAGIVGLNIAREAIKANPDWYVALVDNQTILGNGVSGRNSGVIHAGLYYAPDSYKAKLCLRGNELTYEICAALSVPYEKCGKLIVATNQAEISVLRSIYDNALQCGAPDLQWLNAKEANSRNTGLHCESAVFSPHTGILDPAKYIKAMLWDIEQRGVMVSLDNGFQSLISFNNKEIVVQLAKEEFVADRVITCAGLYEVGVVEGFGIQGYANRPNKGEYFLVRKSIPLPELIYPVPEVGGLGIHLTRNTYNEIYAGPSAQWVDSISDYRITRTAEEFAESIARYYPSITSEDLQEGYTGIRPKVAFQGELVKDFQFIRQGSNILHLIGIESPGLTAAPAIGEYVARNWLCSEV